MMVSGRLGAVKRRAPIRYLVLAWLVIACGGGETNRLPPEAWGSADYAAAGLRVDHPWTSQDDVTAAQVLETVTAGHRERLPRFHGEKSGAVFASLVADLPDAPAEPIQQRFGEHAMRIGALTTLAKLYLPNQLDTPPREWIELVGATLREAVVLERDADAFIASFGSDDPSHATRLAGLAQMSSGYGSMLVGGLLVADQVHVPEGDRVAMLEYVTAALPVLFPRANPDTQHQIRDVLAKEVAGFPAGRLAAAAAAAQRALPAEHH